MFDQKELESGQQVNDLFARIGEVTKENQNLHQNLSELQDKYKAAEEDIDCYKRNSVNKDKEFTELHASVTRLLRTCNEQEETIEGLREGISNHNQQSTEQLRLTGVEQTLRKEIESSRQEVDSLRRETIDLYIRLKDSGFSTFKVDQELWSRTDCLQSQGMCLINDCVELCSKLLEKRAHHFSLETKQGNESERFQNFLDNHFILESYMKLQWFKRGAESLTRSLQNVTDVLRDKSCIGNPTPESERSESDLKAERLLTSLLMEKPYAKEVDVERLKAELATSVTFSDVKCRMQWMIFHAKLT